MYYWWTCPPVRPLPKTYIPKIPDRILSNTSQIRAVLEFQALLAFLGNFGSSGHFLALLVSFGHWSIFGPDCQKLPRLPKIDQDCPECPKLPKLLKSTQKRQSCQVSKYFIMNLFWDVLYTYYFRHLGLIDYEKTHQTSPFMPRNFLDIPLDPQGQNQGSTRGHIFDH